MVIYKFGTQIHKYYRQIGKIVMGQEDNTGIRIPAVITLKDVVTFVSIAVSISLAWGVFGTRLTVIEKELMYQSREMDSLRTNVAATKEKLDKLEARVRDNENIVENIWTKKNQ